MSAPHPQGSAGARAFSQRKRHPIMSGNVGSGGGTRTPDTWIMIPAVFAVFRYFIVNQAFNALNDIK